MATGKSAIGSVLARRLQTLHLDTDAEIERTAGKTIPQIFLEDGETAFRAQETALLTSLAPLIAEGQGLIVSTGGGTPLRPENAVLLRNIGTVIWLQAAATVVLARVGRHLSARPMLAEYQKDPLGRIESLLAARAPHYAALADYALDTAACASQEDAAEQILSLLPPHTE